MPDRLEWLSGGSRAQLFVHGQLHPDRALALARPQDIVCVADEVDPAYLTYLRELGLGPRAGHVVAASRFAPATSPERALWARLAGSAEALRTLADLLRRSGATRLHPFVASGGERSLAAALEVAADAELRVAAADPAVVARAKAIYAPMTEMASEQGRLAGEQGRLAGEQAGLAARNAAFAGEQAELAGEASELAAHAIDVNAGSDDAVSRAHEARQRALEQRQAQLEQRHAALQKEIAGQQRELQARQEAFQRQQETLARRQQEISRKAEQQMQQLLEEAIRSGKAQPARTS